MSKMCVGNCMHGRHHCPTPYTCGIYKLEEHRHSDVADRLQALFLLAAAFGFGYGVGSVVWWGWV